MNGRLEVFARVLGGVVEGDARVVGGVVVVLEVGGGDRGEVCG